MRQLFRFLLVLVSLSSHAYTDCVHAPLGFPDDPYSDITFCRDGYAIGYDYESKIPVWTMYRLTRQSVFGGKQPRKHFFVDRSLPSNTRSSNADYFRSGYDKGHLASHAQVDYSKAANDETYFLSNIAPQLPAFNRDGYGYSGAWGAAEGVVRRWVKTYDLVYVISGSNMRNFMDEIGNGVKVPSAFYKILYAPNQRKILALWLPHKPNQAKKLCDFTFSVDQIEEELGIDFKLFDVEELESVKTEC